MHLAGNIHFGEQALAVGGVTSGLVGFRERVTWRAKHFWMWQTLTSEITLMQRPVYFQDIMIEGAFRFMRHDHFFRPVSANVTEMRDVFCFAAPLPVLGAIAEEFVLRRYMRRLLKERIQVLKDIAESDQCES